MLKNRIEMHEVIADRTHFSSRASSASAESFRKSRAKFWSRDVFYLKQIRRTINICFN